MKTVTVKNLVIGEGAPKIIVSLMGKDIATVKSEALAYREADFDILEWRVDHFTEVSSVDAVLEAARAIRDVMSDKPLLFTFRSAKEGGEQALAVENYIALNRAAVDSGLVDMIDLELFTGDELIKATVEYAHANNVAVIMSNHDFHKTPAAQEIVLRLRKMQELGADIPKIALMPQNKTDVLTLLGATLEMQERYADRPIITMSMAKTGVISRLSGEVFGSAATFGAVKKASAPGQISVTDLRTVLTILHQA
ncbi:type I 3-dehydroquinate dehydratase [Citrobacter freundii]|jgi:3-dehydroquinate dehydratase-1|uniref:type I 3-dehydroquinate dehydratase n=1 Tax=Citrobacter braakii TaxID=57706 RepID=UPI001E4DADCF|nr:type I 3-dehydroquinate dehydratase [Citrobacter braakii]MCW1433903.1 type I 3-dehydroquinate dehydratase [Citrobacter freundii]MCD9263152.1 type I 3-dehydroquinate dehydratase [Citrobacter braakii]MCW1445427.1 type I 3-dehydroquinate dehydratase [Citrobacter freundii]MDX7345618.1 type I 3-dehydroquinate dehydratase [Citrobacter braakii]MEB8012767.1 type I 3-dehydroquinate dehydratase [Citrobacter braakii]